jgi:DNA polymerase III subunit epsilon
MIEWFGSKKHPEFWKLYLQVFGQKSKRYTAIAIKTTGDNVTKDVVLTLSGFGISDNALSMGDNLEIVLLQYQYYHDSHISLEYLNSHPFEKFNVAEGIQKFVEYIGNSTIVGFDIKDQIDILNTELEKLNCGQLKNEQLDILLMHNKLVDQFDKKITLNDICTTNKVAIYSNNNTTTQSFQIGQLFLILKQKLGI